MGFRVARSFSVQALYDNLAWLLGWVIELQVNTSYSYRAPRFNLSLGTRTHPLALSPTLSLTHTQFSHSLHLCDAFHFLLRAFWILFYGPPQSGKEVCLPPSRLGFTTLPREEIPWLSPPSVRFLVATETHIFLFMQSEAISLEEILSRPVKW